MFDLAHKAHECSEGEELQNVSGEAAMQGPYLALSFASQLRVIDLGIAEALASVGGCVELRLTMPYDI